MFTIKNSFIKEIRNTIDSFDSKALSLASEAATEEEKFKSNITTQTYRNQRIAEIQGQFQDAQVAAAEAISKTNQDFNARVDIWAAPSGAKLEADVELLKGGITLTQEELISLIDKHKDSAIMQRAFKEYCNKMGITVVTPHDPTHKKDAFQKVVNAAVSMASSQGMDKNSYAYSYYTKHWDEVVQPIDDELGDMKEMYTKSEGGNMPG